MNQLIGWIVWHLARGYSEADTLARWNAQHPAPTAQMWADALAYAQGAVAAPGQLTGQYGPQTVGATVDPALIVGGMVEVNFDVYLQHGPHTAFARALTVGIPAQWTTQQMWDLLGQIAQQVAGVSGGQVANIVLVP